MSRFFRLLTISLMFPLLFYLLIAVQTARAADYTIGCHWNTNTRASHLIQAITSANADNQNSVITLQAGCVYTLSTVNNSTMGEATGLPIIVNNGTLTINGNGATIERSDIDTPEFRLLLVNPGATLIMDHLTLRGGNTSTGGGVFNSSGTVVLIDSMISGNSAIAGGGVFNNSGTMVVTNSTISGNSATNGGGAFNNSGTMLLTNSTISGNSATIGGGVFNNLGNSSNDGRLTITNSTIYGNSATNSGGGIFNNNDVSLRITNSTISGNTAGSGGGIESIGMLNVTNSTISGNTAGSDGGGIRNRGNGAVITNSTISGNTAGSGGGVYSSSGTLTLNNTIVANSPSGEDCINISGLSGSHNLIEDGTCLGSLSNSISGDPMLGALAANGGRTFTHALDENSPAINAGSNTLAVDFGGNTLTTDQRRTDYLRVIDETVDLGAFEATCSSWLYTVSAGDSSGLVRAVNCANTDRVDSTITLTSSTYTLTDDVDLIFGGTGLPAIVDDGTLTINGNGATVERMSLSTFRLLYIDHATVTLNHLTLSNGDVSHFGGAIFNAGGMVTLTNSRLVGNMSNNGGGGIFNSALGTVVLTNTTLSGNSAGSGGGIFNGFGSTVVLTNSTLSGNSAGSGGGVTNGGMLTITNSTLSDNSAGFDVGGLSNSGTVILNNSIIANSSTEEDCLNNGTLSGSHNLIEDGTCLGSLSNSISGDPLLGALQTAPNGTQYHPLLDFSPAVDAGSNALAVDENGNPLTIDQAGQPRFVNDATMMDTGTGTAPMVDLGAVERQTSSPPPTLSINDATRSEGNSGVTYFTFTITLSRSSEQPVTVSYASVDGTAMVADNDYVARTGVLVFNPGVTQRQVSVVVNRDTMFEADETFTLNLKNPVNATIADGQGVGTVSNDDAQPTLRVGDLTQIEGGSGASNFTFTVTLSNASSQMITAEYATTDGTAIAGSDYASANGTVTFNPGVTSQQITVSVTGDITHETHETFTVDVSNPVNTVLADGQGAGLIANDDGRPTITINDLSRPEGSSGATNFPFVVTLSNPSYQTITVSFATGDGTATLANNDYTARSGVLTFDPGMTSRQLTVVGNGDTVLEPNEIFNLYLSNPTNATLADNRGIGTIANDDSIGLVAPLTLSAFAASLNEGQSAAYTVTLNAAPADLLGADSLNVQMSFDPGYLSVTPALLSFDATNWNIPQTVTVLAVDDQHAAQQTISLPVLHTVTAGDVSLNGAPFGVTITDNDVLLVPVAPELPQIEAVAPVSPDAPSAELPGVVLVSPVRETGETPVAFTWIGTGDAAEYRLLVQTQADRAVVIDQTISAGTCNGNICVFVSSFAPQAGVGYVWTVTPITSAGAGAPSAEAGFSYSPSAPDGLELPGTIIGQ